MHLHKTPGTPIIDTRSVCLIVPRCGTTKVMSGVERCFQVSNVVSPTRRFEQNENDCLVPVTCLLNHSTLSTHWFQMFCFVSVIVLHSSLFFRQGRRIHLPLTATRTRRKERPSVLLSFPTTVCFFPYALLLYVTSKYAVLAMSQNCADIDITVLGR